MNGIECINNYTRSFQITVLGTSIDVLSSFHHHHHHHADIYNAPITTKQEHRCSTKIQIVVDETY